MEITPKSIVLDLLRVAPEAGPAAVGALVEVGSIFGFSGASMRVAVSRLAIAGLLESDERGLYRLGPGALSLGHFVEQWRKGEDRLRPWRSQWLCLSWRRPARRAESRKNEQVLRRFGFRATIGPLWMRPDNLALDGDAVVERLRELGFTGAVTLFRAQDFPQDLVQLWANEKWDVEGLRRAYATASANLSQSHRRLTELPLADALIETFVYGGAAIGVLASDPLLPDEIFEGDLRRDLTEEMLAYDSVGRQRWWDLIARKGVLRPQLRVAI